MLLQKTALYLNQSEFSYLALYAISEDVFPSKQKAKLGVQMLNAKNYFYSDK